MQSHIVDIEDRLRSDEQIKSQSRTMRPAPVSPPAGSLSSAVKYGLKRQLALLKSRLKKEEKLLAEVAKQCGEGAAAESSGVRQRKNSSS